MPGTFLRYPRYTLEPWPLLADLSSSLQHQRDLARSRVLTAPQRQPFPFVRYACPAFRQHAEDGRVDFETTNSFLSSATYHIHHIASWKADTGAIRDMGDKRAEPSRLLSNLVSTRCYRRRHLCSRTRRGMHRTSTRSPFLFDVAARRFRA